MPNHLAGQSSPYLLQHVDNPVDWFPWCDEAFREARARDKPVFLSIGYSACHWCHVMAHESFEDERIARLLNDHFIAIKVDREERPEVDQIYMEAVQRLTGGGGWPLSVFLTPSRKPFFGGTYWPPRARAGMPGFEDVLEAVGRAWRDKRESLLDQADALTTLLRESDASDASGEIDREPLDVAGAALARQFDPEYGGFGAAPKFPAPLALRLLLRTQHEEESALPAMVAVTLDRMAAGGMYDQIGGGFHRYSTDRQWRVPHFEKMLYDNALLAACYLEAWQVGGDSVHRRVVVETLDYVLREMTHPGGGFYTAQDADSGGGEGTFYLWTADEIHRFLGRVPGKRFCEFYGVTDEGNFEGRNILYRSNAFQDTGMSGEERVAREREFAENRRLLLEARARREWPGRDDKILASWNGLMIDAMARAGAALAEPRYLEAAARAADFLLTELYDGRGRLRHGWCGEPLPVGAYLDDHASLAEAFITLYETRFEPRWLDEAVRMVDEILARFTDDARGDFFQTADDHEPMITRGRDMYDSPVPSGGGMATMALLRLAGLLDREDYREAARRALRAQADSLARYPQATCQMLLALDFHLGPTNQIAIVGGNDPIDDRTILAELHRRFIPNKVVAYVKDASLERERHPALLAAKEPIGPGPTVYVCRERTCRPPLVGVDAVVRAWSELARSGDGSDS